VPDATLPAAPTEPPAYRPPATPPAVVTLQLFPGAWVPLDGTSTAAEDGNWLVVGNTNDVWLVTRVASDPTFTQFAYLDPAAGGQVTLPAELFGTHPGAIGQPRPAPSGAPEPPPPIPIDRVPIGGAGGGLIIPDPRYLPVEIPIFRGLKWVEYPGAPGYFSIPLGDGMDLQIRPDADGGWSWRVGGAGGMPWFSLLAPPAAVPVA
jgi:hypothetical protein